MKTKYYFYVCAFAGVMSACESKLDIPQQGVLNMETYYQTDEDAQEALAAVYGNWAGTFVMADYMNKVLLADDCYSGGNGPSDGGDRAGFSRAFFDANCGLVKDMYGGYYTVINRANLVINNYQERADSEVKKQAVAEARFFRAYCYLELVTLWGNPPLVTTVLDAEEGAVGNTPAAETWDFIESELEDIIQSGSLTEKSGADDVQAGVRPTKQTAQAYLGKTYLAQGKYAEALAQFKKVIQSGKYRLMEGSEYGEMFHLNGNYSPEYLLSNNTVQDAQNGYYISWLFSILNNWLWGNAKFRVYDQALFYQFCGYDAETTQGYGFFNPTPKLAEAFVAIEGKDGFRLNKTILSHDKMHSTVGAWLQGDSQHFEHVGWYRYKLLSRKSDQYPYTAWGGCAINLPAMRYAEVLLMAAEAGLKSGDGEAIDYFNQVRTRAQAPTVAALSMELIQNEFFVETCFEGHRFQDLQRWDRNGDIDMATILQDKGKQNVYFTTQVPTGSDKYERIRTTFKNESWLYYVPATETRAGFSNYEKLLPYPQAELDVNPNIVQNEGWTASAE